MTEPTPTLESLAARVAELERVSSAKPIPPRAKDWRRTIGMFADSEFARIVDEEARKIREADREEGRNKPVAEEAP